MPQFENEFDVWIRRQLTSLQLQADVNGNNSVGCTRVPILFAGHLIAFRALNKDKPWNQIRSALIDLGGLQDDSSVLPEPWIRRVCSKLEARMRKEKDLVKRTALLREPLLTDVDAPPTLTPAAPTPTPPSPASPATKKIAVTTSPETLPLRLLREKDEEHRMATQELKRKATRQRANKHRLIKKVEKSRIEMEGCEEAHRKATIDVRRLERALESLQKEVKKKHAQVKEYKAEVLLLENKMARLEERLAEQTGGIYTAKEGGRYTQQLHDCIMQLSDLGISDSKVGIAINIVLHTLFQQRLSDVPSADTVARDAFANAYLAREMINQTLEQQIREDKKISLASDETTNGGRKLQEYGIGFHADGEKKVLYLGLREVVDKSSKVQLDTLMDILARVGVHSSLNAFKERLVCIIHSTQSDSAATQRRFTDLLREAKVSFLSTVKEKWDTMSSTDKEAAGNIDGFFCQLHHLSNLSDVVRKVFCEQESISFGTGPVKEPTSFKVISEVARLFGKRSASLHGINSPWRRFAEDNKLTEFEFPSLLGHRFNIYFILGARVFCHRENLQKFIRENWPKDDLELEFIVDALNSPLVLSQLRLLGLLDQYIAGPMWRIMVSSKNIMQTNVYVGLVYDWLQTCLADPRQFFAGDVPLRALDTSCNYGGSLYKALKSLSARQQDLDGVSLCLTAVKGYFEKVFNEFLPGGTYANPSPDQIEAFNSVPNTNCSMESGFGLVDWLLKRSPNMRVARAECVLLMKKNRVFEWLSCKSSAERQRIMSSAILMRSAFQAEAAELKTKLTEDQRKRHIQLLATRAAKQHGRLKVISDLTSRVLESSFARTPAQLEAVLSGMSSEERRDFLELQIRFRQRVWRQPAPEKGIYILSHQGQAATWQELKKKVLTLIHSATTTEVHADLAESPVVENRRFSHTLADPNLPGSSNTWGGRTGRVLWHGQGTEPMVELYYDDSHGTAHPATLDSVLSDVRSGTLVWEEFDEEAED